jgi:hypothetical protein
VGAVLVGGLAVLLAHARPPEPVEDVADEP